MLALGSGLLSGLKYHYHLIGALQQYIMTPVDFLDFSLNCSNTRSACDLANLAPLVCDVDRWHDGRVSALHSGVAFSISGCDDALLMKHDKVETDVQCFVCHMA